MEKRKPVSNVVALDCLSEICQRCSAVFTSCECRLSCRVTSLDIGLKGSHCPMFLSEIVGHKVYWASNSLTIRTENIEVVSPSTLDFITNKVLTSQHNFFFSQLIQTDTGAVIRSPHRNSLGRLSVRCRWTVGRLSDRLSITGVSKRVRSRAANHFNSSKKKL